MTVLWPPSTDLRIVDGSAQVQLNGVTAAEGDVVELGGGGYNDQAFVDNLTGGVGHCGSTDYWLASSLEVVGG